MCSPISRKKEECFWERSFVLCICWWILVCKYVWIPKWKFNKIPIWSLCRWCGRLWRTCCGLQSLDSQVLCGDVDCRVRIVSWDIFAMVLSWLWYSYPFFSVIWHTNTWQQHISYSSVSEDSVTQSTPFQSSHSLSNLLLILAWVQLVAKMQFLHQRFPISLMVKQDSHLGS